MKIILFVVDGMRPDSLENIESAQRIIKKSTKLVVFLFLTNSIFVI